MRVLINAFLRGEIEAEVRRQMAVRAVFTALTISRLVQATGVRERHRNLKDAVHAMYERGAMPGYERVIVVLADGSRPWLYRPRSENVFHTASNRRYVCAPNGRIE
jgi:hypothetical protein